MTISDPVTLIGNLAFAGCTELIDVAIPESVISIGEYAFAGCTRLIAVSIPDSVTSIADGAFHSCASLTKITIEDESKVEFNPASIIGDTAATIVNLAAEELRYIAACPKLQMAQFSNAGALADRRTTSVFDAGQAKESKVLNHQDHPSSPCICIWIPASLAFSYHHHHGCC